MEPHSGLNDLDYIVIGIILLSGLLALMRGFLRELFSLIAWSGAYFAAAKFYPLALPTVHHYIKHDKAAEISSMALVFIITLIILIIIGNLVCGLVRGRALTTVDRSLGFLYGLARGALVVCLVYLGAVMMLWPDIDAPPAQQQDKDRNTPPDLLMQAKTRSAMAYGANLLKGFVPKEMIDEKLKSSEKNLDATEKAAKQQILDTLSTPAPPGEGGGKPVDPTENSNQGSKP